MPVLEAVVVDEGRTLTRHECSEFKVRDALRRLQKRFHLRPSGQLDDDTKTLMSRGRCGNSDSELQPETVLRQTGSRGRQRRSVVGGDLQIKPEIVVGQTDSRERQRRGNSKADVHRTETEIVLSYAGRRGRLRRSTDDGSQRSKLETTSQDTSSTVRQRIGNTAVLQRLKTVLRLTGSRKRRTRSTDVDSVRVPITRRMAEVTSSAGIDHADLHSRLVPGTDHEPALTRRTKMLIEIRKRHRLQLAAEAAQGAAARRNHTEEELAAIRRRIRNGRAQRAQDIQCESTPLRFSDIFLQMVGNF